MNEIKFKKKYKKSIDFEHNFYDIICIKLRKANGLLNGLKTKKWRLKK